MAAKREKKTPEKIKTDGWVATFGDLISLMLTFFVLLVSMSTMDDLTLKDISSAFSAAGMSVFDNASNTDVKVQPVQTQRRVSMQELMLAARQKAFRVLQNSVWEHKVRAIVSKEQMTLRLPDTVLFEAGKAGLKQQDITILKRLARLFAAMPGHIRVEGHTGPEPLPTDSPFPSTWDLSLARAASVLHVLEAEGVSRSRLSLVGYGPSKPISTDATPFGRSKNRRVDIVLYQPRPKKHRESSKHIMEEDNY